MILPNYTSLSFEENLLAARAGLRFQDLCCLNGRMDAVRVVTAWIRKWGPGATRALVAAYQRACTLPAGLGTNPIPPAGPTAPSGPSAPANPVPTKPAKGIVASSKPSAANPNAEVASTKTGPTFNTGSIIGPTPPGLGGPPDFFATMGGSKT